MVIRVVSILLLSTIPFIIGMGCSGSNSPTLATVNGYEITVEEFDRLFRPGAVSFASAEDEYNQRRLVLDSMIATRLLIQGAYDVGLDQSQELARAVLGQRDRFLINALYKNEIVDKAEPSDAEVRDFFNHLDYKIKISQIVVPLEDTANMIFDRLKEGESFEKLAVEFSIDPSVRKNQGDLGYLTWGILPDEVQEAAFAMENGELSPPIKSMFGWYIIKLVDRLPNTIEQDFESMKTGLKQQIHGRNVQRLTFDFMEKLKKEFVIIIDTTTCEYLLHKRQTLYPPQLLGTLPRSDFDLEQLDRNEKELPMAIWDGGQLTVSEYLVAAARIPLQYRPDFDDYDSLAVMVFQLKREDILIVEAHKKGYDTDREYTDNLRLFKELTMAEIMKKDSLPKATPPEEAEIRQYYDDNLEEFTVSAKVKVWEILVSDELKAKQQKKEIRTLAQFKEAALQYTERSGKRPLAGDLGYINERVYPNVYAAAVKTDIGRIGGPVFSMGKHSIFYVEDKIDSQVKDFLGIKRQIYDYLAQLRTQAVFAAWVDERKAQSDIMIDEQVMRRTIDQSIYTIPDTTAVTGG